jgi:hypothetical protein
MRLVLLISLLTVALQADPITVIPTTSGSGVTDLSYSAGMPAFPGPVTAQINGYASCFNNLFCGDQPATAAIDLTMDLYTAGPIRDGIALLQLNLTQGGAPAGNAQVSGAIGPYSLGSCPAELTCVLAGYFPFELGVPFTIDLSGLANGPPPVGGAQFIASASLQLYELPTQAGDRAGAAVPIYLIPEPSSAGLAVTGLSALMLFAFIRRRNIRPL